MTEFDPNEMLDDRLTDLVIKELGEPLSETELRSLAAFDAADVDRLRHDFERAAAAVTLAARLPEGPLPAEMQARLERRADDFLSRTSTPAVPISPRPLAVPAGAKGPAPTTPVRGDGAAGWWAAAACLVLAVFGWLRSPSPAPTTAAPPDVKLADAAPAPAALRAQLLASGHALRAEIPAGADPGTSSVTGDVVWDPVSQRGYMRFVGLKPNDPALQQYQIWVFDGERDQRYPVDGGIFDVPVGGGDVVIPIRVAVPVRAAKAFAVTVEKPGGVVVSSREHVVALARLT
jgi:hypothetical protein